MGTHPMPAMSSSLLPEWARITWAALLLVVVVLHVWHAASHGGQHRWWHVGHTIMALGMIGMYLLPGMSHPVLAGVDTVVFALVAVAMGATAVLWWRREGVLNPLWLTSVLDMLVMVFMALPAAARPAAVTWVLVVYLGAQTLGWAAGVWGHVGLYRPAPTGAPSAGMAPSPVDGPGAATAPDAVACRVGLTGRVTVGVRVTLAVMAASMAYMLAAMTAGT